MCDRALPATTPDPLARPLAVVSTPRATASRAGTVLASLPLLVLLAGAAHAQQVAMPDDLSDFRHVHSFVIDDPEHPLFGVHHFYANAKALDALQKGGPYPEGAVFLGSVFAVVRNGAQLNEGDPAGFTLMRKDPRAEQTGGWRFAQFDPEGELVDQDEATACFQCHTQVADRDYVFSKPLEPALPRP